VVVELMWDFQLLVQEREVLVVPELSSSLILHKYSKNIKWA
jgi:hypothetical protein